MKKTSITQRADTLAATREEWKKLREAGITKLRCGHWSRRSLLGCARPQGHEGKHDLTVEPRQP